MRWAPVGSTAAGVLVALLWFVPIAPSVGAATDTTTTATTTAATGEPAPAVRGTAVQVVPTLAPPDLIGSSAVLPADTGSGRRVVYSKSLMRVWIVDSAENIERTYLVSGRLSQPRAGTYFVFSRSTYTCSISHSNLCMRWMVRFTHGPSGDNIGSHEIPRQNGVPVQGNSQLGQALSSGCVRQSTADAQYMWAWAGIGTKVVVI